MNILLELINRKSENTASGTKNPLMQQRERKKNKTKQNSEKEIKTKKYFSQTVSPINFVRQSGLWHVVSKPLPSPPYFKKLLYKLQFERVI